MMNWNTAFSSRANCKFHLPSSLYTSGTLEVLKLFGPFRVKPPNVVCLPKLVQMDLREIIYESDEAIPKLITGCPVLRSLTVFRLHGRDNLVVCSISSPVLKHLHIGFQYESNGVDMKLIIDCPALIELTVLDRMSSHISIQQVLTSVKTVEFSAFRLAPGMIVGLMQTFSSVQCLKFYLYSMMEIEKAALPVKVSFKRLTKLVIQDPQWSSLMDLLDGCSILEELVIWCHKSGGEDPWRDPARVPRCLSSSVRHISVKFDGLEKEVAMLKFFLDHCLALERVDLCCEGKEPDDEEKRLRILDKVSKLSRASPACKISRIDSLAFFEDKYK